MKRLMLTYIAILMFLRMDNLVMKIRDTWCLPLPLVYRTAKDSYAARLLAKELIKRGIFLILVKHKIRRSRYKRYFVLMSLPDPNAVVTAVLDLSGNRHADVTLMRLMRTKCTGNIYVTTPTLQLTALDALILAYENAHGPALKVTLVPLKAALNAIMLTFQLFANLPENKSNSIVIIQSGGFHVKGVGGKTAQIWEVLKSTVAGEILMTFVFAPDPRCYDIWLSTDGIAWHREEPSIYAHARLSGLTPNTFVWVKYKLINAPGGQPFSTEIKVQVPA